MITSAKQAADVIVKAGRSHGDDVRAVVLKVFSELDVRTLAPKVILEIAEVARPSVEHVIVDYRTGFADRALPLGEEESRRFANAMALVDAIEVLYQRVLDAAVAAPPGDPVRAYLPQALERCMACKTAQMIEHYRARQGVGFALWKRLQAYMQTAARENLQAVQVADPLDPRGTATPGGTYGRALLLSIAQAGAMAHRNLEATLALTALFADQIESTMLEDKPGSAPAAPQPATGGVGIQRSGRVRVVAAGGITHLVNTAKIDKALGAVIQSLGAGSTPEQIGLGHVAQADLASLLPRLRRIWCGAGEIRETPRVPLRETGTVASGFSGIAEFVSPGSLNAPENFEIWDHRKGPQLGKDSKVDVEKDRFVPSEHWEIHDHSASGMRARRKQSGARLRRHQLLAVDFDGMNKGSGFTLGEFRWLQQHAEAEGGGVSAGVRFLSTHAKVVLVRVHGRRKGEYQAVGPAFLLTEATLEQLVVPYGWFAANRDVDIWQDRKVRQVRFTELKGRGADFEIGACEPIQA